MSSKFHLSEVVVTVVAPPGSCSSRPVVIGRVCGELHGAIDVRRYVRAFTVQTDLWRLAVGADDDAPA